MAGPINYEHVRRDIGLNAQNVSLGLCLAQFSPRKYWSGRRVTLAINRAYEYQRAKHALA